MAEDSHITAVTMVAAGANVEAQASHRWGALADAAHEGHLQVVKYLVEEAGADERRTAPGGETPLKIAARKGHTDIVEYLRQVEARRAHEEVRAFELV